MKNNKNIPRIHGTNIDDIIDKLTENRDNIKDLGVVYSNKEGAWSYSYMRHSNHSEIIFALEFFKALLFKNWFSDR